jgi:hypothetical protein
MQAVSLRPQTKMVRVALADIKQISLRSRTMDLRTYLATLDEPQILSLAISCDTTPLYLRRQSRDIRRGKFYMNPRLASLLEQHTNKSVRRWECIPVGWWVIWPELVGSPGAPPVPATEAANDEGQAQQRA